MKKVIFMSFMALCMATSFTSCRDKTEKEKVMDEMNDNDADVKINEDGDKIKMETEDKKVKIKEDENGDVTIKEKTKNDDN